MHLVSQFQDITTVVNRKAAKFVMKMHQWNLNRAIDWFHGDRHDIDIMGTCGCPSDLKRDLKTKEELREEETGRTTQEFKEISL